MKRCEHCRYADWRRTDSGRLHPSGDGACTVEIKMPVLPASMYWPGYGLASPKPSGGSINRRRELSEHCPRYAPKEPA